MTENLLSKLEEKVMTLLSEVEVLRREIHLLTHENTALKTEREGHGRKLRDLISLLDSVDAVEGALSGVGNLAAVGKPMLVQG